MIDQYPFVGRLKEKQWIHLQLDQADFNFRVLNVYGTGGIGKSSLVEYFRWAAEMRNVPFLLLDSRDFSHTPAGFSLKLLESSKFRLDDKSHVVETAWNKLNRLAVPDRLIIAIDTYEEMLDMDFWLRTSFLPGLSGRALLVLSGRYRLSDDWNAWPLMRKSIHFMPLEAFDLQTSADFAELHGIKAIPQIERLHTISNGHPLTLSLFVQKPEIIQEFYDEESTELAETLKKISSRWLREIPSPGLQVLIEAASMIRIFNQESLESMLQTPVDPADFDRLTALSFVKRSRRGWFIHDGLRKALLLDFRLRKPQQYQQLRIQGMIHLYRQFEAAKPKDEKAVILFDLLYLMRGQSFVRAVFMDENEDHGYFFKTIRADSVGEMKQYMQMVLNNPRDVAEEYVDPHTLKRHTLQKTHAFIRKAYSLIDPDLFLPLGEDVIRLLMNNRGEPGGLIVFLPIHRESLPLLQRYPCSRSYFAALTAEKLKELETPPNAPAGWFLYHIDMIGDSSPPARQHFFEMFMKLFIRGGLFVISSPIDYIIQVNKELGFREVPEAGHADLGPQLWSTTLEIDLRGDRLNAYIQNTVSAAGVRPGPVIPEGMYGLSDREREVAHMLMECETNAEIAKKLHIAEITVKKHMSQVYQKLKVKNRTECIKKLMSQE